MNVKYGPIICDSESEEAKALVGKKVVGGYKFTELKDYPERHTIATLNYIKDTCNPFVCRATPYTFIREVIEEKPKYRPYKDTEEMIEDYKERFCKHTTIPQYSMPLIWIENRNVRFRFLVSTFGSDAVHVEGSEVYSWLNMENLFRYMNYLDGSPVGKKEEE